MTSMPSGHKCPVCDHDLHPGETKCPNCHSDLRLFGLPADLALDFYNEGLDRARAGDREGALEKVRGAIAADPSDVDAYIVLGKLLAQSGKPSDMEEAIAQWEKARSYRPTGEQSRKLDKHIATADASLREISQQATARQRALAGVSLVGAFALAALCGFTGYFLRSPNSASGDRGAQIARPANGTAPAATDTGGPELLATQGDSVKSGAAGNGADLARKTAGDRTPANGTSALPHRVVGAAEDRALSTVTGLRAPGSAQDAAENNPVAAIKTALKRPDITVIRTGDRFALIGKVTSISEKKTTLSAAAYAANTTPDAIDGNGLKVKPDYVPVGSARVQKMLDVFIDRLGRNGRDPLTGARVMVLGGIADTPLRIVGTCASPKAGPEIADLIKAVYPSANSVDTTGLKVRGMRLVARTGAKKVLFRRRRARSPRQSYAGDAGFVSVAETRREQTYRVRPGDTIFHITREHARDGSEWRTLWNANRGAVKDPMHIPSGTILKLPHAWSGRGKPAAAP